MADDLDRATSEKDGWKKTITGAKIACAALVMTPPAVWTSRATDGFTVIPAKVASVSASSPSNIDEVTQLLKVRFLDVIIGYARNGGKQHTAAEIAYGKSFGRNLETDFEVLDELHTPRGFYGVLLRDKVTGATSLNMTGWDTSVSFSHTVKSLDDAFMLTSGGSISQTNDAINFAKHAQAVSVERTGKPIASVSGHSLGAYLASYLAAGDVLHSAKYYMYDAPGITSTLVQNSARLFNLSKSQVESNLRDHCYSFTFTHNTLNTLGTQPGVAMTVDNQAATTSLVPGQHIYEDSFVKKMGAVSKIEPRTNDEDSHGPKNFMLLFLAAAGLPFAPDIVRRLKKPKSNERE